MAKHTTKVLPKKLDQYALPDNPKMRHTIILEKSDYAELLRMEKEVDFIPPNTRIVALIKGAIRK